MFGLFRKKKLKLLISSLSFNIIVSCPFILTVYKITKAAAGEEISSTLSIAAMTHDLNKSLQSQLMSWKAAGVTEAMGRRLRRLILSSVNSLISLHVF